jgi:hypothetical protein
MLCGEHPLMREAWRRRRGRLESRDPLGDVRPDLPGADGDDRRRLDLDPELRPLASELEAD